MYNLSTMLQCVRRGGCGFGTQTVLEVMCIADEYSTPSSYCQIAYEVDFCLWVTTESRCHCNVLSHAFYGFAEICSPCDH